MNCYERSDLDLLLGCATCAIIVFLVFICMYAYSTRPTFNKPSVSRSRAGNSDFQPPVSSYATIS
ncbi:p7 [Strawberry chlorotic fleck-associated virus]|uniref:p7 n=1 Tax=Strawberry chlorotic fleck-associated virus TaxID=399314 RepID=Q0GK52_9CLOS|nr:p7 [Strawberry chlorotic fleck-associated virus]ABI23184.1 p7 [Strawberry chlorotic fleck-associated virus]QZN83656.1 p7 [Strawberry chlorotic fleck-associated virus]